ncbi:hypothetical protein ACUY4R_002497 [Kosakonia sp. BK9b]|uniref:hypothetical protein n=1 Tax=Kosakonia sp. TaxID=1916651 RepID=UPI00289F8560|nr:hypothetical protein [Kosakonia sp.]
MCKDNDSNKIITVKKKWVIQEDPAILKQQGPLYKYFSSFCIALLKSKYTHYAAVNDMEEFVKIWRPIAINMGVIEENIDVAKALEIQRDLAVMEQEWPTYKRAVASELFRGDSLTIAESYPWLDSFIANGHTTVTCVQVDQEITSPIIMSTSTDPAMGYAKEKPVLWHFDLDTDHRGVEMGLYLSEKEVTFPLYNRIWISSLIYLPEGHAYQDNANKFGVQHRYIIKAKMLPPAK